MSTEVDLTEFYAYSKPKRPPCRIGFTLTQLKPKERRELEAALAADGGIITASAIVQWAKKRGQGISIPGVTAHRRGACNCGEQ